MLWIKSLHIIAAVCWFASLFYLPRLFVYHSTTTDEIGLKRFQLMERKLYYGIAIPSMITTLIFGIWLMSSNFGYYLSTGWIHAKLSLIILLIIYHHMCGFYMKQFVKQKNKHSHKFFRIFNEIPVIFLILIVILAVVKPF